MVISRKTTNNTYQHSEESVIQRDTDLNTIDEETPRATEYREDDIPQTQLSRRLNNESIGRLTPEYLGSETISHPQSIEEKRNNENSIKRKIVKEINHTATAASINVVLKIQGSKIRISKNETKLISTLVSTFTSEPQPTPRFPKIIFILAIIKDVIDAFDFTGVGVVAVYVVSIFVFITIFIWSFNKISLGGIKRGLFRFGWKYFRRLLWRRVIVFIMISGLEVLVPWFRIIPAYTLYVLYVHNRNVRLIKVLNAVIDYVNNIGLLKKHAWLVDR